MKILSLCFIFLDAVLAYRIPLYNYGQMQLPFALWAYVENIDSSATASSSSSSSTTGSTTSVTAEDDPDFRISDIKSFLAVPNSCFTVMFADPKYY